MFKKMTIAAIVMVITGCATKQYPQAPVVTGEEARVFDCNAVNQEIAKSRAIQNEIVATSQFDGRSILAFLGDFGIGNAIAHNEATKKVNARLNQLETLKAEKCGK
ncbi:hypothetical protein MWM51_002245 [Salmonella enterica]|nr:hypothetical protein [Salmonella enterica]EIK0136168.1 hypothetical protein [Salmonella enterica]EJA3059522.1 hypothetical protein [Salmonella enterica]EKH3109798.1 hypothetical protein [Salmonella enterica]